MTREHFHTWSEFACKDDCPETPLDDPTLKTPEQGGATESCSCDGPPHAYDPKWCGPRSAPISDSEGKSLGVEEHDWDSLDNCRKCGRGFVGNRADMARANCSGGRHDAEEREIKRCDDDGCLHYDHPAESENHATTATVPPLRIEDDYSYIYWHDPVEGCWVAYRRADCVGEEELPTRTLAAPVEVDESKLDEVWSLLAEVLDSFTLAWARGKVEAMRGEGR